MGNIQPGSVVKGFLGAMPGMGRIDATHVVAPMTVPLINVVPMQASVDKNAGTRTALTLAEGLAPAAVGVVSKGAGALGAGVGAVVSIAAGGYDAKAQIEALTARFGSLIAAEMGKPQEALTEEDMRAGAVHHEFLQREFDAIDHARAARAPKGLAAAGGGALAGAAAGSIVPGLGTVAGLVVGGAASCAGCFAADRAVNAIDTSQGVAETPGAMIQALRDKVDSNQPVSTADVFRVFVQGKPELQDAVRQVTGENFPTKNASEMNPEELAKLNQALNVNTRLRDAAAAIATHINNKVTTPESLIAGGELVDTLLGIRPVALTQGQAVSVSPPPPEEEEVAEDKPSQVARLNARRALQAAVGQAVH